jgi:hypothetical protein
MTAHTMEQIEVGMLSPMTGTSPKNSAVSNAAKQLFDVFSLGENKTTRTVVELSLSGMTCQEYNEAEKGAIALAASVDRLSGWVVKEGVKGRSAYGPKQSSMASQASQRRQIFGASRLNLSCIVSVPDSGLVNFDTLPSFVVALNNSRAYLKANGLDWTGQRSDDLRQQRADKNDSKARSAAREQAEEDNPRAQGEDYKAWQLRILEIADDVLVEMEEKEQTEKAMKVAKSLLEKYGVGFCQIIMDNMCTLVEAAPAPF